MHLRLPPPSPGFFGFSSPESDSTFVNSRLGARGFGEEGGGGAGSFGFNFLLFLLIGKAG